jgi:flagellar biosynthesis/type III secretory pathway M-ring protein FliF/YscJ
MNAITPWAVCLALFLMLAFAVYAAIKSLQKNRAEIKRLTAELEAQKKVNIELANYAAQIAKINGDQSEVTQQIEEAENEEEVLAIIAGLVSTNNDRVRKQTKG